MIELQRLQNQIISLLVYRDVLRETASQACLNLLSAMVQPEGRFSEPTVLQAYGQWFYALACLDFSWPDWIEQCILTADNPFTQQAQHHSLSALPQGLVTAVRYDLTILQRWALEGPQLIQAALAAKGFADLPSWDEAVVAARPLRSFSFGTAWAEALPVLLQQYQTLGVGLFARYRALRWRNGHLEGIDHPEAIQMVNLVGYNWQQTALKQNTEALLAGNPALNVLLYGARGSGKSALIKALLWEYGDRGLRLIELNKADMIHLPEVAEQLRTSALKFVIFIDDLSFEEEEDHYKALKVVLEGTLTSRPQNVVVYATSNRRHLIREFFSDRPRPSQADEVHTWDTVQEKLSLSDRFGLTLTFEPATQDTYLQIVHHLAQYYHLKVSDELTHQALQWAVRHNARSGRTARQFIDYVRGQKALNGS
jgi:hypothetical protein